jgi:hypothetical protein
MGLTKRNHYNPCFWTAFWNPTYYDNYVHDSGVILVPREQVVYALNVKSDKIVSNSVENVHYDKNFGVAEISFETAKEFCKRHHPNEYEEFCRKSTEDEYPIFIDFEDFLIRLEETPPYRVLCDVIKRQDLISAEEKAFLASFVFLQLLRSHAIMNSALEWNAKIGIEKFEYFVLLKWFLSNPDILYPPIAYLALAEWTLYRTYQDSFPLTDSCILVQPQSIMVALSPKFLLEITPQVQSSDAIWHTKNGIDKNKLVEFRRRTIGNTFREIIFSDKEILKRWQIKQEFMQRVEAIRTMKSYNKLVEKKKEGELWLVNALGNQQRK